MTGRKRPFTMVFLDRIILALARTLCLTFQR
jgi:hypothetical protein